MSAERNCPRITSTQKKCHEKREKDPKLDPKRLMEFFRGRPGGGDNFTSLFQVLQTFIESVKSTLSHLTSCNPVGGAPRQAPLELLRKLLGLSVFLKHAFREVTWGFCKGTVPGAPLSPPQAP